MSMSSDTLPAVGGLSDGTKERLCVVIVTEQGDDMHGYGQVESEASFHDIVAQDFSRRVRGFTFGDQIDTVYLSERGHANERQRRRSGRAYRIGERFE